MGALMLGGVGMNQVISEGSARLPDELLTRLSFHCLCGRNEAQLEERGENLKVAEGNRFRAGRVAGGGLWGRIILVDSTLWVSESTRRAKRGPLGPL